MALDAVQRQDIAHLLDGHGILQVLLVGHYEDGRLCQVFVVQKVEQLILHRSFRHPFRFSASEVRDKCRPST